MSASTLEPRVTRMLSKRAPSNVILDALRASWHKFIIDTEVWEDTLTAIDAVADQAYYTLTPEEGELLSVVKVVVDDEDPLPPGAYYVDEGGLLRFEDDYIPSEDGTGNIVVTVTLAPTFNGEEGPSWAWNRWSDTIISGAIADLCGTAGQPWYDPGKVLIHKDNFNKGVREAIGASIQKRTKRTGFSA